jgi:hypothetical protein
LEALHLASVGRRFLVPGLVGSAIHFYNRNYQPRKKQRQFRSARRERSNGKGRKARAYHGGGGRWCWEGHKLE